MVYYKIKVVKEYKNICATNNNIHIYESKYYPGRYDCQIAD